MKKDSTARSEARAPARAYAICACEEASSPDVITELSFDDSELLFFKKIDAFTFDEFDMILGMDWLTLHDAVVSCRRKTIELKCQNSEILRIESNESSGLLIVISSISAQRYVRKGCEAYLAYVLDTKVSELKIESVPIVCEYPDLQELSNRGFARPSFSPWGALVLFVKKKDG
ncbi:ruBisCO large subunit-binding protein subunit alpha, chloroplastic-like [Gossypium australe]|uniref:RuBisCO large subunit-binding protein subunit alpha, chloroplastic-like n=1 Tax=Gossypium australe TaxID=47621 RepID=A0A5B6WRK5_9ROSI|nr:ruBisCO large subunit-binding protein subunit alpha, chloroplastic-like [Gossypium australe]